MAKRIDTETKEEIIRLSQEGVTLADIAEKTGVSVPSISKIRKEAGIGRSRKSSAPVEEGVTTSKQLEAVVKKVLWPSLSKVQKAAPKNANAISIEVSITVGSQSYGVEELIAEASKEDQLKQKQQELEEARKRVAAIEAEMQSLK